MSYFRQTLIDKVLQILSFNELFPLTEVRLRETLAPSMTNLLDEEEDEDEDVIPCSAPMVSVKMVKSMKVVQTK